MIAIESKITFNAETAVYSFEILKAGDLLATYYSLPSQGFAAFLTMIAPYIEQDILTNLY